MRRLVLILFLGLLMLPGFVVAQTLTPERAGDAALEEARQMGRVGPGQNVFLGDVASFPGLLRIELRSTQQGSSIKGKPFAIYEFDSRTGRIVRHDFLDTSLDTTKVASFPEGRIAIHGVLRNLPGYILNTPDFKSAFVVWAEAQGRVVATDTELFGTTAYLLKGIPTTVGSVAIKAKIRGYDLLTLHPGVPINPAQPAGTIGGIDVDFHQMTPILRDVRLVVQSTPPAPNKPMSFPNGARARVTCQQTGKSVEVISMNGMAEAVIPEGPTGWNVQFLAINLDSGYFSGLLGPMIVPEDGGSAYTDLIQLK